MHRASDSTRSAKGRTFVFADRRSTFKASQTLQKEQKLTNNRSDNASRTHSAEKTRFFRSRTRLGVDFCLLGVLPGAPGRLFWRPGAPLATLRTLPRRAGDAPGRSRDAPETPSGCSWTPRGVWRGSRDRFSLDFGCPEVSPGIDFRSIFTVIVAILQASWPANSKTLDG